MAAIIASIILNILLLTGNPDKGQGKPINNADKNEKPINSQGGGGTWADND